MKDNYIIYYR